MNFLIGSKQSPRHRFLLFYLLEWYLKGAGYLYVDQKVCFFNLVI